MSAVVWTIVGMTLVTYVPRLLPLVLRARGEPPAWMKRTLQLLPYTAIGALLIPDAFGSAGTVWAALCGLLAAALVTWLTRQPFLAVLAAIAAVALGQLAA